MLVLGIESSCDETAAALVADGRILSSVIASQVDFHARFGGVVPELAARRHTEAIGYVLKEALENAGLGLPDIEGIAVTARAGLVGSLVVGVAAAKSLAYVLHRPLAGIHHIEGHIFANILSNPQMPFPHVCLTVSGGHTMLVHVAEPCRYRVLGNTLDDAAGEAFDKVAKFLGLGFPGGPVIDRLAAQGKRDAYALPRPLLRRKSLDFSFSGLKTAVVNMFKDRGADWLAPRLPGIAASFQEAVVEVLVAKTLEAARRCQAPVVSVTGGVSANRRLREAFREACPAEGLEVFFPEMALCGDNAAMIAAAGQARLERGDIAGMELDAVPNAPLTGTGQ